ncbi:ferric reductase transmembrane component 2 precursor [Rhodotorula toruloides]|uniref:ferric-chelate reductase (NADPH) n=1 Tax=Rhodotorula toruloides TaxID=5286 RepID=A0A511KHH1_RHOTO|nr:ferric reductase transmembrane component 2 precursor [Rhodotorula toruloides]
MSTTVAASQGGAYIPPFATRATTTAAAAATGTTGSLSFARIASQTGSATTTAQIVDSTGGVDSSSLLLYFTRPYIDAHTLSMPTWRYAYILWFAIVGALIVWSAVYRLAGTGTGGSALGAWFRKWSIRRITWTKKVGGTGADSGTGEAEKGAQGTTGVRKKVVSASPTFAQMIAVGVLVLIALLVSFVGDDYIAPTTCTFGGDCGYQAYYGASSPPRSTYRAKRALALPDSFRFLSSRQVESAVAAQTLLDTVAPSLRVHRVAQPVLAKRGVNNPNGWAPFNDPLLASSNTNIAANAWTAAARLGLISYAMLPLVVTLALKQWPFNIWATPFLTNYHFDKTAILHRWSGRVVWAFSTGHAIGWIYELCMDRDPFGRIVLVPALQWYRFVAGIVCWFLLTILTAFSFRPLRNRFYELFYWSHVVLVILVLVTAIIHHRPLMYWPIVALAWWGAERAWRFMTLLWINGVFDGIMFRPSRRALRSSGGSFSVVHEKEDAIVDEPFAPPVSQHYPPSSPAPLPYQSPSMAQYSPTLYQSSPLQPPSTTAPRALPPPGFANAQLLPGRTIRLTIQTPHAIRWAAGQHLLLYIPSVRLFESHPYTIAGVDERTKALRPVGGKTVAMGSEIVLLIRAQQGFSRALWNYVVRTRSKRSGARQEEGVTMRALVSWPMGSAGRVHWGAYESLTIICGGTGVTFGISVLENACRRMVRRDQQGDAKWRTTRVRFVWILREYAHLSWVAPTLRRCIEMCDPSQLHIELFVTHDAPKAPRQRPSAPAYSSYADASGFASTDDLAPPTAPFVRQARSSSPSGRASLSELSDFSDGEETPSRKSSSAGLPQAGQLPEEYGDQVDSVTDLVLFDGEEDYRTAGDERVSAQLKKEGKLRRALSRRGQGRSIRRPGDSAQQPQPAMLSAEQSFEALPLDHRDELKSHQTYSTPYDYPGSAAASFGDLGQMGAPVPRDGSFDWSSTYDDATLGDSASTRHLVKPGARPGLASNPTSHTDLASEASLAYLPPTQASRAGGNDGFFLDVTDAEQADIEAVAELAKTGYPRLKQLLDEEVQRSAGKTIVACCGPASLNSVVRNLVASKIDLKKVARGDPRGQVSLVVEDFAF